MIIFKCDGCEKQAESRDAIQPIEWFARTDYGRDLEFHACSTLCVTKIGYLQNGEPALPI